MDVQRLTEDKFASAVEGAACLVIEFSDSADDFTRRAARVAGADDVEWGHVDKGSEAQLMRRFGIEADDALLVFREQIVFYLERGKHDPARISDLLTRIRALDMQTVRAEIEAERQAELALRMRRVCPTALRGEIGK